MRRCQLVLVVDDDPAICRLLELRLRTDHIHVLSAATGAEAQRIIAEHGEAIDLILLDVGLPDTDGFALCRALRQRSDFAGTPIIFLTGRDSPEDAVRGFNVGGTDYVVKPFHHAVLHARVNAALRTQQLVHERCEAEHTLRKSEERYRYLTEHCFDMISRHDREGQYIDVSQACEQLFGYHADEIIGRSAYDFIHPDDHAHVLVNHRSLLRGESSRPVTYRGRRADGTWIWLESICRVLPDSGGEINCVTRDVTLRKQHEDAIRASEAKLQAVAAQLPAIVWTTDLLLSIDSMYGSLLHEFDLDGRGLASSRRFAAGSLPQLAASIAGCAGDSIVEAHRSALRGESINARFSRDDRDFEARVEPLLGNTGECIGTLGIVFDVTERRRIEEVERSEAALEDAVTAMEQVLGVIGHELRTPLTGLRVMAEFLLNDLDEANEVSPFLSMIHNESIRMATMVNNLLEAARINSGMAQWNWSTFDLTEVCHNALDIVRHASTRDATPDDSHAEGGHPSTRHVTFGAEVCSSDGQVNEPLMMQGDRDAIHRLIINLVTNAERHTREGVVMVKATESHRDDGRWIDIEIRDTGEGMPPHIVDKLGVPFALNAGVIEDNRTDGSSYVHGCGLGLAISKGITLAHGGSIRFESLLGMGTTVYVTIRADLNAPALTEQHAIFVNEVSR